MELQHIELTYLKTTAINVRKKGAKDIADLVPSIKLPPKALNYPAY